MQGPISQAHAELAASETAVNQANAAANNLAQEEADKAVAAQAAQKRPDSWHGSRGGSTPRDDHSSTAHQRKAAHKRGVANSDTKRPLVHRGVSGLLPRVNTEGQCVSVAPADEEGTNSTAAATSESDPEAPAASTPEPAERPTPKKPAPPRDSPRRNAARQSSSRSTRGSTRGSGDSDEGAATNRAQGPTSGSDWLNEYTGQYKQFAQINKSITKLWKTVSPARRNHLLALASSSI